LSPINLHHTKKGKIVHFNVPIKPTPVLLYT
jgi:hypothetical protein